ncbi:MAG: hypothetical protein KIT84_09365 [Labilithrix sp.]|nr:hypothetical protein [Labilithrix sp.]MCW5811209.1 hypothetical protein [Labilithrix sp.]
MRLRFALCLAAPLLVATASTPARADDVPALSSIDSVHLRNGGLYRGRVTEIVPGDHVTILVEKGESKRIAWGDIDKVVVASSPPPGGATATDTPTVGARTIPPGTPAAPAPMSGPRARVHVVAPNRVILYRRPAGSSAWTQACTSPCDEELPIGDTYRIAGNNVAQSKEFNLGASAGATVTIAVDPPSMGGIVMGGLIAGGGVLTGYVGLLLAAVSFDERGKDKDALLTGGLIAMGVGAVATVGGLILCLTSATTDIHQTTTAGPKDAALREPTWRTADRAAMPAAQFPLLFSGSF